MTPDAPNGHRGQASSAVHVIEQQAYLPVPRYFKASSAHNRCPLTLTLLPSIAEWVESLTAVRNPMPRPHFWWECVPLLDIGVTVQEIYKQLDYLKPRALRASK